MSHLDPSSSSLMSVTAVKAIGLFVTWHLGYFSILIYLTLNICALFGDTKLYV